MLSQQNKQIQSFLQQWQQIGTNGGTWGVAISLGFRVLEQIGANGILEQNGMLSVFIESSRLNDLFQICFAIAVSIRIPPLQLSPGCAE